MEGTAFPAPPPRRSSSSTHRRSGSTTRRVVVQHAPPLVISTGVPAPTSPLLGSDAFCPSPALLTPSSPQPPPGRHHPFVHRDGGLGGGAGQSLESLHISLPSTSPRSPPPLPPPSLAINPGATSHPISPPLAAVKTMSTKKADAPAQVSRAATLGDDAPPSFAEATGRPPRSGAGTFPFVPPPSAAQAPVVAPTLKRLFTFSTRRDVLTLLIPGLIASTLAGIIQPLMTLLLGEAFQAFIDFALAVGPSPSPALLSANSPELLHRIKWVSIALALLALANATIVTLAHSIWWVHGSRIVRRLQEAVYASVQAKEMGWFDTGMPGLDIGGEEEGDAEGEGVAKAKESSATLMGHFLSLTDDVRLATTANMGLVVQYLVTVLACLGIAFRASWQLTLAIIATIPVIILSSAISERALVPRFLRDQDLNAQGTAKVEQVVGAMATVKAFNAENVELKAFESIMGKISANYRKWTVILGVRNGMTQFLCLSVFVQGFGLGSVLVTTGRAKAGDVNTVFWAVLIASSMMQTMIPTQTYVEKGKAAMAKLVSLIEASSPSHATSAAAGIPVTATSTVQEERRGSTATSSSALSTIKSPVLSPRSPTFVPILKRHKSVRNDDVRMLRRLRPSTFSGELSLHNVTFHYPSRPAPAPPALYDVTLYIPPRETTYIVGQSGSGKSTVAALLLGLYRPSVGTMEAEEQGYEWLDEAWLRHHVGCVSQGTAFLIEGTVHDNVALGVSTGGMDWRGKRVEGRKAEDVRREEVEAACRAAMVHEFIIDLPEGYDTWLSGEKGASLSGGQRQRIALARAFIRNPTVLILDEATSALDATTRVLVHEAVKRSRHNMTTVCITHDLSPIQASDFVYVMENGEVVQQGYRSDLEQLGSGVFCDMVRLQAQNPVQESTVDETWEILEGRAITTTSSQDAEPEVLPPALSFLTSLAAEPTVNYLHPDGVSFSDRATRRLTSAWRQSWATRRSRPDLERASSTTPLPTPDPPMTAGRAETPRVERMSSIMSSGRAATMRRAQRSQMRQVRRAWTEEELRGPRVRKMSGVDGEGIEEAGDGEADGATPKRVPLRQVFKTILPSVPNKWVLVFGIAAAMISGGMTPVFSVLLGSLMAQLAAPPAGFLVRTTLLILLVAFIDGVGFFFKHAVMEVLAMKWISTLRIQAFGKVLAQDQSFFDREENSRARLAARLMKDASDAREIVGQLIAQLTVIGTMVLMAFVWALVVGAKLTLVGVAMGPLFIGTLAVIGKLQARVEARNRRLREDVADKFFRTVANIKAIRSMSIEPVLETRFHEATELQYRAAIRAGPIAGFAFGATHALIFSAEAVLFWVGAIFVSKGWYSFERMTQIFSLIIFAISFTGQLISYLPSASKSVCAAIDMHRLVHLSTDTQQSKGKMTFPVEGQIKFNRVNFNYPARPHVPVLKDVSLAIWPGEFVGVVGASGSGKSTIASLVQRLYEPTSGRIALDTRSLAEVDVHFLRNNIGVVSQHPLLFDASVSDNIAYGCPTATQAEIELAAQQAHAHDFIMALPEGYQTRIGEGGTLISGGQAQRVQIARALLRSRPILVLDEYTSALDPANQAAIMETIMEVKEGRTTIIVTHKMAVMKMCDRLVVVDEGRIVEQGTFEELINRPNGPFATLAKGGEWTT